MRIRPAILTAALVCATFALPAPALAGDAIPGASYKDRPRGEVKTVEVDVSLDGRQIDNLDVRLEKPCGLHESVPTLFYVKIKGDGSFRRKLKSGAAQGHREVLKVRGEFSGDGRKVSGRWSYTDVGYSNASANCRAVARFKARTDAKPVEDESLDSPVGRWSGTTVENLPIEFELFRSQGESALQMRDIFFQVNVVCEDLDGNQSAEVYEGRLDQGDVYEDGFFMARDSTETVEVEVTGRLDRDTATGQIKVSRAEPARYCATPNAGGVAFTARPG